MCVIVIGKLITCFLLLWTELERMKNTFPFSTPELCCFWRPRSIREGRGLLAEECWMDSIRKGGDWKLGIFHYSFNRYVSLTYARHFSRHWGPGDEGYSFFPLRRSQSPGRKIIQMNNYNIVGSSINTIGLYRAVRALGGKGVTSTCKWGSLLDICSELARIRESPKEDPRRLLGGASF